MTPYDVITDRIIKCLESGTAPWRRPWGGRFRFPRNLISGKEYRGINVFLLSAANYESPYWVTYKQAQSLGGSVRKGEKSLPIVFWSTFEKDNGEGEKPSKIPFLRYYSGFNLAQCDGIPGDKIPADEGAPRKPFEAIEACQAIVRGMPKAPPIDHGYGGACYVPSLDTVRMPRPESFDSPAAYYAVLFHELGHSTGHSSRLARKATVGDWGSFGSDSYGREELVAEMTAAFLCGQSGIETATIDQSASYIENWLRAIRQDAKLVVTAAAQAQKAADWILDRKWDSVAQEPEPVAA